MKVICIDENFISSKHMKKPSIHPKEGEICTVVEVSDDGFYMLSEYLSTDLDTKVAMWVCSKFIPLSDIDETDLVKEREVYA